MQLGNFYHLNYPKPRAGYLDKTKHKTEDDLVETRAKTAFITGASSGLGAEFAKQLAARGYNLVLTARRQEQLEQIKHSIATKYKHQVVLHPADLSKLSDITQLADIVGQISELDLLVNSAGFGTVGRFFRVQPDKELAMLHVHMVAPVMLSRAALPQMIAQNQGSIINVASLAGLIPIRNVLYHSTKAFLVSFSETLHTELLGSPVTVQALCPGFIYTEFHDTPEYSRFSRQSVPRFLWMTPQQVVSASLRSLNHGKVICIPGTIYGLAGVLARNSITAGLIKLAAQIVLRKRKTFINPQLLE
jgi:short-subunit dehydrogenase